MGIIKYISTFAIFLREQWKSIYLTPTPPWKLVFTNLRDKFKHQIHFSWTSNAQIATLSIPSSPTLRASSFARTANTFCASQEVAKENWLKELPGEERETEQVEIIADA